MVCSIGNSLGGAILTECASMVPPALLKPMNLVRNDGFSQAPPRYDVLCYVVNTHMHIFMSCSFTGGSRAPHSLCGEAVAISG